MDAQIIAALVAAIFSVITFFLSFSFQKKFLKREEEFKERMQEQENHFHERINSINNDLTEKINNRNIDASVKATSRIQWIQNVRVTTSKLLSALNEIFYLKSNEKLLSVQERIDENSELLILYFGNNGCTSSDDIQLDNNKNNFGKNDLIVQLITKIRNTVDIYCRDIYDGVLDPIGTQTGALLVLHRQISMNGTYIFDENYHDIIHLQSDSFIEDLQKLSSKLQNGIKRMIEIRKYTVELRDAIRLYLKIEWDIAKKGE